MIQEDIEKNFWRFRYRSKSGKWQRWSIVESFEEAKELAEYHARGREFELLQVIDTSVEIVDFSLEHKMQQYDLNDSSLAAALGIGQSVITQARKRGRFSAPLKSAISMYFKYLEK